MIEKITTAGFYPNQQLFENILEGRCNFYEAKNIIEMMSNYNVKPNQRIFKLLLKKVTTYNEVRNALQLSDSYDLIEDINQFNDLIEMAGKFNEAIEIYEHAERKGFFADEITFKILLAKARNEQETDFILTKIFTNRIK